MPPTSATAAGIAFKGEELTYDDIIASAAVTPLFRAVHAHGTLYWDGLFSRNPPIREFTDLEQKPDEIWVVRINPKGRTSEPETIAEIADRRNELAGNLALDQELYFIEKINELRTHSDKLQERYKPITIREIALNLDLDYPSKFDRSPALIERLIEDGRRQATLLLERLPGGKRTTTPPTRAARPAERASEARLGELIGRPQTFDPFGRVQIQDALAAGSANLPLEAAAGKGCRERAPEVGVRTRRTVAAISGRRERARAMA